VRMNCYTLTGVAAWDKKNTQELRFAPLTHVLVHLLQEKKKRKEKKCILQYCRFSPLCPNNIYCNAFRFSRLHIPSFGAFLLKKTCVCLGQKKILSLSACMAPPQSTCSKKKKILQKD